MADSVSTTSITNLDASPSIRANSYIHGGGSKSYTGTCEGTAAAAAGSTYRMFRVGSWMRPSGLSYSVDAGSVGAVDIGLYDPLVSGGALVHTSVLAQAFSTDTAKLNQGILKPAGNIDKAEKRIWELLGLATDPRKEYDVAITVTAAVGNAITHTLKGEFAQ